MESEMTRANITPTADNMNLSRWTRIIMVFNILDDLPRSAFVSRSWKDCLKVINMFDDLTVSEINYSIS